MTNKLSVDSVCGSEWANPNRFRESHRIRIIFVNRVREPGGPEESDDDKAISHIHTETVSKIPSQGCRTPLAARVLFLLFFFTGFTGITGAST